MWSHKEYNDYVMNAWRKISKIFLDTDSKDVLDKWKSEEKQQNILIYDYLD